MARERDSVYTEHSLLEVITLGAEEADRRHARGIRHPLSSMLAILLIGFLLGQNTIRGICRFFSSGDKLDQLRSFLNLPFGIPSPSCYTRTLAVVDPLPIVTCYADFLYQLVPHEPGKAQHICADGKALNAAQNRALTGKSLYIINIFLAAYHLFTYQVRVGPKSQEGKVLEEEIYDILYQDPSVVTADAMATKKAIVEMICKAGSNAVLPVKKNNKNLMNLLLGFCVPLAQKDEATDHYLDLNDFSESDMPSAFIENTRCAVFDEDNRKEPDAGGERPIQAHTFFNKLYQCPIRTDKRPSLGQKNKSLFYVQVGNRWVPMAYVHGRFERREYELFTDPALIDVLHENVAMDGWENVEAVGLVTRYRGESKRDSDKNKQYVQISVTRTPYFLTANPGSARQFAKMVKNHWAIEEGHNCLDDLFDEDHSTIRIGNAPETCSLFRKMAYNMISLLDARIQRESPSSCDRGRRLKETMESLAHDGISKIKKLISHRVRSPFLQ